MRNGERFLGAKSAANREAKRSGSGAKREGKGTKAARMGRLELEETKSGVAKGRQEERGQGATAQAEG